MDLREENKRMTLSEAKMKIEQCDNDINKLLRDKEVLESIIYPKSPNLEQIGSKGNSNISKQELYAIKSETKQIDLELNIKYKKKENLESWLEDELKILGKYEKQKELLIYYKETTNWSWESICQKTFFSVSHGKRIYRQHKKKRDI